MKSTQCLCKSVAVADGVLWFLVEMTVSYWLCLAFVAQHRLTIQNNNEIGKVLLVVSPKYCSGLERHIHIFDCIWLVDVTKERKLRLI